MGKRFAIVIGAAALGAAVMAAAASANITSVGDRRGDTLCYHDGGSTLPCSDSKRRNADIVRATAGHEGQRLRHTIRVVGRFHVAHLYINTDSAPGCDLYFLASRGAERADLQECSGPRRVIGHARMDVHRHSVEVFFSKRSIGNPQSYGWSAFAFAGSAKAHAIDSVPNASRRRECFRPDAPPRCWIRHRLGDSGTAATGVMALGAQAAAAAPDVVKYDTQLGITTEGGCCLYHGGVKSDRDRDPAYHPANAVRKCMEGRRVILFQKRPGADRRLGTARSHFKPRLGQGYWQHNLRRSHRAVYAKVTRKVGKRFVCRADRSETKHKPRRYPARAPIHVPGVAAAGVMALGAQTAAAAPDVVKYDTTLALTKDGGRNYHGFVFSDRDRNQGYDPATAVRKCMEGRRVVVFKVRAGADRRIGADRSRLIRLGEPGSKDPVGDWWADVARDYGTRVRAKVERKVRDRYVCRADHAAFGQGFH